MQESTAVIKLTKSEIEWNIIALVWMEKSSKEFRRYEDANMFKKLKEDFIKIKNTIIEGEKQNESRNKIQEETQRNKEACEVCDD